jgi:hypothetical protein
VGLAGECTIIKMADWGNLKRFTQHISMEISVVVPSKADISGLFIT